MIDVPVVPVVPVVRPGTVLVMKDETVGIVGTTELGPTVPTLGDTLIVGTAAAELTPRLLISIEPNGIPVRAAPPGVVGDVDVGVDDEAILLEPEPHIPDNPVVPSIPEVVDIPDVADIPDDDDIPDNIDVPDVAAVAGVAAPTAVPPPSKLAVDPNIPDGEVPKVEHVVLLPGIAIVPVEEVGIGLTPGEAISVEPNGIPVGETDEPVATPSGEVAPMVGVGVAICAMAALQTKSAGTAAAINETLIGILHFATVSLGARPSNISLSLGGAVRNEDAGQDRCSEKKRAHEVAPYNSRVAGFSTLRLVLDVCRSHGRKVTGLTGLFN